MSKVNIYFILFFSCLSVLTPISAEPMEKPLLIWLPLLTSHLQRLQPNRHCPQNQLVNIRVNKEIQKLRIDIDAVDWDFSCPITAQSNSNPVKTFPLGAQKTDIDLQANKLFNLLQGLPETTINIKGINLTLAALKKKIIFSLVLHKTAEQLVMHLTSDLFNASISVNLATRALFVESTLTLTELHKFIALTPQMTPLLTNPFIFTYTSNLTDWGKGAFALNSQGKLADLAEHAQLQISGDIDLLTAQIRLTKMALDLKKLNYKLSLQRNWKSAYMRMKLTHPASFSLFPLNIQNLPLELRLGRSVLQNKTTRGKSQRVRFDRQKLPPVFMALNAQGAIDNIAIDWRISTLNQTLQGKLGYAQQQVSVKVPESDLAVQELVTALHDYLSELQLLEIKSGKLNLQLSALIDLKKRSLRFKSKVVGQNIAGENASVLFDGVSISSQLDYLLAEDQIHINQDQLQLKIANLFVGVPLQALQLDAKINAGKLLIEHFKARLLGGRMDFSDFRLAAPSQTLVNISGFNLADIIKYSAYPEIQSKGIIDGILPVSLTAKGIRIEDGMIFTLPPGGYIKVPENTVINAMGKANPAFSLTMQLLSNFQFDTLQGQIAYTEDGESNLKMAIKGINPTVSGIQPINFNYTHNENILKLLQSLRFNEQLERQIEERY